MSSEADAAPETIRPEEQRLLVFETLFPRTAVHNVPVLLSLRTKPAAAEVSRALDALLARHPVLRTTYHVAGAGYERRVHPATIFPLSFGDDGANAIAQRFDIEERCRRPFDVANELPVRAHLSSGAAGDSLLLVFHHIVCDIVTINLLVRELTSFLFEPDAARAGRDSTPDAPAGRDRGSDDGDKREYWRAAIAEAPDRLRLRAVEPGAASSTFDVEAIDFRIAAEHVAEMRRLARASSTSLMVVLLSAYAYVLGRYADRETILLGLPVSTRGSGQTTTIGYFVETVPIVTSVPPYRLLGDLLRATSARVSGALEHLPLPADLAPFSAVPASGFHACFNYRSFAADALPAGVSGVERLPSGASAFGLTLTLEKTPSGLGGRLEYAAADVRHDVAESMVEAFCTFVAACVAEAETCRLDELPLVSNRARDAVLRFSCGDVVRPAPLPLAELLRFAREQPNAPAVVDERTDVTYHELVRRVRACAAALTAHGRRAYDRIGVCASFDADMVVGMLAVWWIGATYVPIDADAPLERRKLVVSDAQLHGIIASTPLLHDVSELGVPVLEIGREGDVSALGDPLEAPAAPAYVLYTSGSTGEPKGVVVSNAALHASMAARRQYYPHHEGVRSVLLYSPAFDPSICVTTSALVSGGTLFIPPNDVRRDADQLGAYVKAHRITHWDSIPSLYGEMLRTVPHALETLRVAIVGGERLDESVVRLHHEHGSATLWNEYGPTEATIWASVARVGREAGIGRPIPGVRTIVLDGARALVPPGVAGELYLAGATLADGYWRRPEATAERFIGVSIESDRPLRCYRTGDLVSWSGDGDLLYHGRIDRQVKIQGFRVEPGEVEHVLRGLAGVRDGAVVVKDRAGGPRLAAFVVLDAATQTDPLAQRLARVLPHHMRPTSIDVVAAIPRSATGKVDYAALRSSGPGPADSESARVAPRTATESALHRIWTELLGTAALGIDDDLFEAGARSLLALRATARIRRDVYDRATVREVFDHPTIRGFAALVSPRYETAEGAAVAGPVTEHRLTPGQRSIWLSEQLESDASLFVIPLVVRTKLDLDEPRFRRALRDLVSRHPALGARIEYRDGDVWAVYDERSADVLLVPPAAAANADVDDALREFAGVPFDLVHGPCIRAAWFAGAQGGALALAVHHVAADGSSLRVILRDLAAIYHAHEGAPAKAAPAAPASFSPYAARQQAPADADTFHWRTVFADPPPELLLPLDRPRPRIASHRSSSAVVDVAPRTQAELESLARRTGSTLFTVLTTAFATVLGRYGCTTDVVVGVPFDGRVTDDAYDETVGFFVNMLPVRLQLAPDQPLVEVLGGVRSTLFDAYEHGAVPFERIVDAAGAAASRDVARNSLFQASIAFNDELDATDLFADATVALIPTGSVKYDLVFDVEMRRGVLAARLDFATDLFDRETAATMARCLSELLAGFAGSEDRALRSIAMLSEADSTAALRAGLGATVIAPEATMRLETIFARRVREAPDGVAVVDGDEVVTYAALDARANRIAAGLLDLRVGLGDAVGIKVERGARFIAALLGVLRIGATYVPLERATPPDRVRAMAQAVAMRVCIVDDPAVSAFGAFPVELAAWAALAGAEPRRLPAVEAPGPAAYVMFTSGSTGAPKGVSVPHRGVVNLARVADHAPVAPADRVGHLASIAFDASTYEIWAALLNGASLHVIPRDVAADHVRLGEHVRVAGLTVVHVMTSLFTAAATAGLPGFASVRTLIFGGEAGDLDVVRTAVENAGAAVLLHAYGPTECTTFATLMRCDRTTLPAGGRLPIGAPIANVRVHVLDEAMNPLPAGAVGEIWIGGAGVAVGYLGDADLTARRFVDDPHERGGRLYRTGDLGRRRRDGTIDFLGRLDRQLKLHGYRIEPGEIEAALLDDDRVRSAVVVLESASRPRLVAYVASAAPGDVGHELRERLRKTLPFYMMPAAIVQLAALPLTTNGKVDRAALPPAPDGTPREPLADAEYPIARIWSDVLGGVHVGPLDNFFELGGHSLLAATASHRIRTELGLDVTLRLFFEHQTVRELTRRVKPLHADAARMTGGERSPARAPKLWFQT